MTPLFLPGISLAGRQFPIDLFTNRDAGARHQLLGNSTAFTEDIWLTRGSKLTYNGLIEMNARLQLGGFDTF